MNWADYLIIGIIALSALFSLTRGFIKESLSLVAWVVALWVALKFSPPVTDLLLATVAVPLPPFLQRVIVFLMLMLGILMGAAVINSLLLHLLQKTGLTAMDRLLGVVFGVGRGVVIVTGLVLLAGLTPLPQDSWWQESQLLDHFQGLALWARSFLPPEMAGYFRF